jgi:hypothetical protein
MTGARISEMEPPLKKGSPNKSPSSTTYGLT